MSVFYKILYPWDKNSNFQYRYKYFACHLKGPLDGIIYWTLTQTLVISGSYTGHA